MNEIITELLYNIMLILSSIEIFFKTYIFPFFKFKKQDTIKLINTKEYKEEIFYTIDTDIDMDYEFGIVEKITDDDKVYNYLFNELDTDDIISIFDNKIDSLFFSADLKTDNYEISLDLSKTNYFFTNNIIFFKEHIKYLLQTIHDIILDDDDEYTISLIDHNFNNITLNSRQYLILGTENVNKYDIIFKE
jgi:hypothetical protein